MCTGIGIRWGDRKKKSCMENKSTKEELPVSWTRPKVTRADTPQQNHAWLDREIKRPHHGHCTRLSGYKGSQRLEKCAVPSAAPLKIKKKAESSDWLSCNADNVKDFCFARILNTRPFMRDEYWDRKHFGQLGLHNTEKIHDIVIEYCDNDISYKLAKRHF